MSTTKTNNEIHCSIDDIKEAASIAIKSLSKSFNLPKNDNNNRRSSSSSSSPSSPSTVIKSLKHYYSMTLNEDDSTTSSLLNISHNINIKVKGNILSDFLPGYKAPMHLKAYYEKEKIYTTNGYLSITLNTKINNGGTNKEEENKNKEIVKELMDAVKTPLDSFKNGKKKTKNSSIAGDKWFGIEQNKESEELESDLKVLQMRDIIDPKRFYKSYNTNNDKDGKSIVRQVGTVIEGSSEYYSNRMTKKERRTNITEEFMSDVNVSSYTKDKFEKIQLAEKLKRRPTKKAKHNKHVYKRY